jgi:tyrosyl-tRNA synthetase
MVSLSALERLEEALERLSKDKGQEFVDDVKLLFRDASIGSNDDGLNYLKKTADLFGSESALEDILSKTTRDDIKAMLQEKRALTRGLAEEMSTYGLGSFLFRVSSKYVPATKRFNRKHIVVKLGIDPTYKELHLGHTVPLKKAAQFAKLGYHVTLILGTWTGAIGDPSQRTKARDYVPRKEIEKNADALETEIKKLFGEDIFDIKRNDSWFSRMRHEQIMDVASKISDAHLSGRKEFKARAVKGQPASILEKLYPVYQAWDSIEINAMIELGGIDQRFNIGLVRELQREYGKEDEMGFLMPILPAVKGLEKMSKSAPETCVFLNDTPFDKYRKIMEIEDFKVPMYFQLLTDLPQEQIDEYARNLGILRQIEINTKKYLDRIPSFPEEATFSWELIKQFIIGEAEEIRERKHEPDVHPVKLLEDILETLSKLSELAAATLPNMLNNEREKYSDILHRLRERTTEARLKSYADQLKDVLLDIHGALRKHTPQPKYNLYITKGGKVEIEGLDEATKNAAKELSYDPQITDLSDPMHPINIKHVLAGEIVSTYHSPEAAELARKQFNSERMAKYVKKEDIVGRDKAIFEYDLPDSATLVDLPDLLAKSGLTNSKTAAKRVIAQGGLYIYPQEELMPSWKDARHKSEIISPKELDGKVISLGKKAGRIVRITYPKDNSLIAPQNQNL